jgi:hypothetical protein
LREQGKSKNALQWQMPGNEKTTGRGKAGSENTRKKN